MTPKLYIIVPFRKHQRLLIQISTGYYGNGQVFYFHWQYFFPKEQYPDVWNDFDPCIEVEQGWETDEDAAEVPVSLTKEVADAIVKLAKMSHF